MPVSHKFHDSILIFNILGSTFTKKYGRNSTLTCLKSDFTYKETDSSGNTESKDIAIALWLNAILLIEKTFYLKSFLKIIYAIKNNLSNQLKGITFPQPPARSPQPCPRPSAAAPGPIYFFTAPGSNYFFTVPMCQNYFCMVLNYQNYYFTAPLIENICFISVLSKFQTFQLKEVKYVINHMMK